MINKNKYQAAGGVVVREDQQGVWFLLLEIEGRTELRLPKGHVEPGETIEQAAVREVQEETGYADVVIAASLGSITHSFFNFRKGAQITRTESYFLMRLTGERAYAGPHLDHEKFVRRWVMREQAEKVLTYEVEREFARRASRALADDHV
jgi:8-oxo-dGTP pyrophosphatase MutT (NUDIX family)